MKSEKNMIKKFLKKSERGQAIILIAAAFVGLVAMVGLATDGGILLIEYARLKRGIDSASIAAAQQFRRNFSSSDLENAAENFLVMNQSNVTQIDIYTCNYPGTQWDPDLCTAPISKLVRVTASADVEFGFMRVVGFDRTTITATSVGEAASIDLVLIMDTSLGMSFGTSGNPLHGNDAGDDPHLCNINHTCQPLENIKTVAQDFIDTLFFPYDRVAIVTMTDQVVNGTRQTTLTLPLNNNYLAVFNALEDIRVFEPPTCIPIVSPHGTDGAWSFPLKGPCLNYHESTGVYQGVEIPVARGGPDLDQNTLADNDNNYTTIPSSNIGGTFIKAEDAFLGEGSTKRDDAFWVIIALFGGPANATHPIQGHTAPPGYPDGLCPDTTWNPAITPPNTPRCRDSDLDPTDFDPTNGIATIITKHPTTSALYDADDFARDAAHHTADPVKGNGITIFTIGLGTVTGAQNSIKNYGEDGAGIQRAGLNVSADNLLRYIAEVAGDSPGVQANHGFYSYAEDPSVDLGPIFFAIAENIFTRISQ